MKLIKQNARIFFNALQLSILTIITITGCTQKTDLRKEVEAVRARSKAVTARESEMNIPEIMKYWAKDAVVQAAGMPQIQGTDAIRKIVSPDL